MKRPLVSERKFQTRANLTVVLLINLFLTINWVVFRPESLAFDKDRQCFSFVFVFVSFCSVLFFVLFVCLLPSLPPKLAL